MLSTSGRRKMKGYVSPGCAAYLEHFLRRSVMDVHGNAVTQRMQLFEVGAWPDDRMSFPAMAQQVPRYVPSDESGCPRNQSASFVQKRVPQNVSSRSTEYSSISGLRPGWSPIQKVSFITTSVFSKPPATRYLRP